MLRRLFALVLAFSCAFAPGMSAFELATGADACCCGAACGCPPTECAPPPAAPLTAPQTATAASEQRAAAKPRARVATTAFARFLSASLGEPASTVRLRARHGDGHASAASVALFQAHCSLLL